MKVPEFTSPRGVRGPTLYQRLDYDAGGTSTDTRDEVSSRACSVTTPDDVKMADSRPNNHGWDKQQHILNTCGSIVGPPEEGSAVTQMCTSVGCAWARRLGFSTNAAAIIAVGKNNMGVGGYQ